MADRNIFAIFKALTDAFDLLKGSVPTGYPNSDLTDKGSGMWFQVFVTPGPSSPVTLGEGGEDDNPGFMQIDINFPKGKGDGAVLEKADDLLTAFPAGRVLTYNGQDVHIKGSSVTPPRYVGGYYRVSLTINYYARTTRASL